jgi:hypothetical protein
MVLISTYKNTPTILAYITDQCKYIKNNNIVVHIHILLLWWMHRTKAACIRLGILNVVAICVLTAHYLLSLCASIIKIFLTYPECELILVTRSSHFFCCIRRHLFISTGFKVTIVSISIGSRLNRFIIITGVDGSLRAL